MGTPSDGDRGDGIRREGRENPNSWRVISDVLATVVTSASNRHQEDRERTTNAEIGAAVRMLPDAISKLIDNEDARKLVARFPRMLEAHLASHALNSPVAAARAEGPLNKSITDLRDMSALLRTTVLKQGKGITLNLSWHEVAIEPLSQRVAPADMVLALDRFKTAVITATKLAAQSIEEALDLQHPIRHMLGTEKSIAPPIHADGPIAIVLPDRSYTSADDHVRYVQKLLLDLASHVDTNAKSFALAAQKSHDGSNPRAIVNTAQGVLEYAACLVLTCDQLRKIAAETPPYPTTKR